MKNPFFRVQTADFVPAKYDKETYRLNIPAETNIDDLLCPEAWVNISNFQTVLPGSFIRCVKADLSFACDLLVIDSDKKKGLTTKLYYVKDFTKDAEENLEEDSEYQVAWAGKNKKHVITRKSDNEEIQIGIPSKKAALEIVKTLSKQS